MNKKAFFAPFIRGAIINKTKRPWVVSFDGDAKETDALHISIEKNCCTIDKTDEEAIAAAVNGALQKAAEIPCRISIDCCGTEQFSYLSAPNFTEIEKVKTGKKRDNWDTSFCGAFTERNDAVKNRIALVTGGAQGFGEELVRGLVSAGAFVFIADLNLAGAEKLAAELNTTYGKTCAFAAAANVGDETSVAALFETIALTAGGLDLCVSNAGILRASSILEQDISSFKLVTDINYTAFAAVTKHAGLLCKKQNTAAPHWTTDIIQINSKSGLAGSNKNGSYAGGKFGGIGLVQSFALELIQYGIKVNAICPGNFYDGPLWSDPKNGLFIQYLNTGKVPGAKTIADVKTFYEAKSPIHRGCTGHDVLKALLYIVEQQYETGQAVPVTGGQVMLH